MRFSTTCIAGIAACSAAYAAPGHCAVVDPYRYQTCASTVSWVELFSQPSEAAAAGAPEQFNINYGFTPDTMVVGWITSDMTAASVVQYGLSPNSLTSSTTGSAAISYVYSAQYTSGAIHHVTLSGLAANTRYFYRCGAEGAWSPTFSFKSNPGIGPEIPFSIGIIADIGENKNANDTITHLLAAGDGIDAVVLNGDISYASGCEGNNPPCEDWNAFQRMTQALTAQTPMMVNIGNHETYDITSYAASPQKGNVAVSTKYRYAGMPSPTSQDEDGAMYFSFEAASVHYISISSMYPTELNKNFSSSSPITQWLLADLAKVDRTKTPWLLVGLHAPWYNSNTAHQLDGESMREAYEPLFVQAQVDAIFTGHVHSYERTHPVINFQVNNTHGITHFNTGDAGADLYTDWFPASDWVAFRNATFGHGIFSIYNSSTALWTWHEDAKSESIVSDSVVVECKAPQNKRGAVVA